MSSKTLLTASDLEQMPDDDSVQIELDEGELITMPPAGGDHGYIGSGICSDLRAFVKKHRLGRVYSADTGFQLSGDTVRAPDLAFVRKERVEAIHSQGFMKGAPDLAVEILSPFDSFRQLMRKVKQYLAAGCHTVWVVHPERKRVYVFEANGTDSELGPEDMLEAPELLPGFSVKVAELFESS
jgi:Uma2 family endonuclease